MKKYIILVFVILAAFTTVEAQKYFTRSGTISFYSEAPLEKIEAVNNKVTSVIDLEAVKMDFAVLIKAFQFEKALMQEHFNENYMESGKYPKAVFKGQFDNLEKLQAMSDGSYPVKVSGEMTIHGVTKKVEAEGKFTIKGGVISGTSKFIIAVADYEIEIPAVVKDNIAKEVSITVKAQYEELKG